MREIKFRAWHDEKMYDVVKFNFRHGEIHVAIGDCTALNDDGDAWLPIEYASLMQYTGLKDKNGKEIYEGDIVKEKYAEIVVVEFGYHETSTDYYNDTAYGFYGERKDGTEFTFSLSIVANGEIIGNTYENSDLLKFNG